MTLSKREHDRLNADPKRSEAANKGAWTRQMNQRKRETAIKALMADLGGRWPTEEEIAAQLAETRAGGWKVGDQFSTFHPAYGTRTYTVTFITEDGEVIAEDERGKTTTPPEFDGTQVQHNDGQGMAPDRSQGPSETAESSSKVSPPTTLPEAR